MDSEKRHGNINNEIKEEKKSKKSKKKLIIMSLIVIFVILLVALALYLFVFNDSTNIKKYISKITDNIPNDYTAEKQNADVVSKDIFGKYYDKAENLIKNMSLKEKVGQMCFARCPESGAIDEIKNYNPAGYILFGRDFKEESKASVTSKIKSYQDASKIKMLIGVDEEGGTVTRVSHYSQFRSTPFKSPQQLYKQGGYDLLKSDANEKITLLASLGINVNLAPVSDVSTNPNDFIYDRSFGKDATETSKYVSEMTKYYNSKKMGMTLKHFPGYGNNADTHKDFVRDNRSEETFKKSDFLPFEAGIKDGAQSILVAHNVVSFKDNDNPASLSKSWHTLLREDLKFTGVIMTDDLAMGAIANIYSVSDAAIKAVNAGNDLLITSDLKETVNSIVNAVNNKTVSEDDINQAVKRVLAWKYYLGIIS